MRARVVRAGLLAAALTGCAAQAAPLGETGRTGTPAPYDGRSVAAPVDRVERRGGGLVVTFSAGPCEVLRAAQAVRVGAATEVSVRLSSSGDDCEDIALAQTVSVAGDPGPPYRDAGTGQEVPHR